jgi:hypothetical protein
MRFFPRAGRLVPDLRNFTPRSVKVILEADRFPIESIRLCFSLGRMARVKSETSLSRQTDAHPPDQAGAL